MDFVQVASTLLREFAERDIHYAVIGGFALGFWGVTRATVDMDFLLLLDDAEAADAILHEHGFVQTYRSENVAQYVGRDASVGSIDILFAFRRPSRQMLEQRVEVRFNDTLSIFSLIPEDIIGLKVQAIANDPSRRARDLPDIRALLQAASERHGHINWSKIAEYFRLFGFDDLLLELERDYGNVD